MRRLSEREAAFKRELETWLSANLPEGWTTGTRPIPVEPAERERFLRQWLAKLAEGGWAGISWPVEYGGRAATPMEQAIYEEVMARFEAPPLISRAGIGMVGHVLLKVGTEAQKRKYIPRMLTGEELWCLGLSEPEAGSDLTSVGCFAERRGDVFVVNGRKIWTTGAETAERCFFLCRSTRGGGKHDGMTIFALDMRLPGIEVRPIPQINGDAAFCEVTLNDVEVPADDVIGEVDKGWRTLMVHLGYERGFVASMAFALPNAYRRVLDLRRSVDERMTAEQRVLVDAKLAEFHLRVQAALWTYRRTLLEGEDAALPHGYESLAKLMCSELNKDLHDFALELLDHEANDWPERTPERSPWHYEYLTAFHLTIAGGTSDIQRNVVAERILGLPKDAKV